MAPGPFVDGPRPQKKKTEKQRVHQGFQWGEYGLEIFPLLCGCVFFLFSGPSRDLERPSRIPFLHFLDVFL